MAESNQNIINFSDSVANIIKNIQDVGSAQVSLVKAIATTSGKVVATDVSIIEKNIKSVNLVNSSISNYLKNISAFIKDISNTISNENSNIDIKSIFGYMERVDEIKNDNGGVDKKVTSKFLLIDGLSAMMSIFSSMTKIIEGMANSKFDTSSLLLGTKIKTFTNNIKTLLSMAVSSLKDINNMASNIDIERLMGGENTVDKNNIERQLLNGQLQNEKTSIEKTTSKKYGIIEVIEKFFGLGNLINQIEAPNILSFSIKLKFFDLTIKQVISKISNISKQYSSEGFKTDTDNFSKITENLAAGVSNIQDLMDYIMMSAVKFKFSKKSVIKFFDSIWSKDDKGNISGVLPRLFYIMKDRMIGDIGSEKTSQLVETASQVSQQFTQSIASILMVFGDIKMRIKARFADKTLSIISIFLGNLCDVITKTAEKFEKLNVKTFKETLSQISDIVDSLKNIVTRICVVGLLALPAMIFMISVIMFTLMLIPFLFIISKLVVIISKINDKDVSNASKSIAMVLGLLVVAALSIISLQYIMMLMEWDNIFKNLALLFGVLVVSSIIVALLTLISRIEGNSAKTTALNVALVIGLLIMTALMLKYIQFILIDIKWGEITSGLLKMGGVLLAIMALAGLLGAFAIIYIPIMIGLAMMVGAILSIFVVATLLIALQSMGGKINEKILVGDKKEGDTTSGGIIGVIMRVMGSIGDIAWKTDFLNPLTLVWVTLKFAIMTVTIGLVFLTGGLLLLLQNTFSGNNVLDRTKIESAITNIFDSVQFILDTLNTRNDSKTDESKRGLLTDIISMVSPSAANLLEAILSFAFVITTLMTVGAIYFIGKLLNEISTIQWNDPTTNIENIIGTAKRISDLILSPMKNTSGEGGKETKFDKFKNWFGNTGVGKLVNGAVEIISNIGATGVLATILPSIMMLNSVVDLIKSINELTIPKDINTKVSSIIDAAKIISDQVRTDGDVQTIDEDKVKSFGKFVDNSIKYFEGINKLDVSKVRSLGDMYEKMGQFMETLQDAPINDIADALVNKISPALSDINTSLNKKPTQTTQTTPTNSTNNTSNIQTTQTTSNNPVDSNQPVKQIDYSSMLENIEGLLEQIKKKLSVQPAF
jgi:hypothetical protein